MNLNELDEKVRQELARVACEDFSIYTISDICLGINSKSGRISSFSREVNRTINATSLRSLKSVVVPEIGDLLWLLSALCNKLDVSLEEALKAGNDSFEKGNN